MSTETLPFKTELKQVLFLPAHKPFDLMWWNGKKGLQLYIRQVFIMDDCRGDAAALLAVRQGRGGFARSAAQRVTRDVAAERKARG